MARLLAGTTPPGLATAVLLVAVAAGAASAPLTEADYDRTVGEWHEQWTSRRDTRLFDRRACVAYWQDGDPIRQRMHAATAPPSRTAYHEALLAFVDAALAAADECIGSPTMTMRRTELLRAAIERHRRLVAAARAVRPPLPLNWL